MYSPSTTSPPAVRHLPAPTDEERSRILQILEAAFAGADTPPDQAVLCMTGGSKSAEHAMFRFAIEAALRDGELWVAGLDRNSIDGVALWISPGNDWSIGSEDAYKRMLPEDMKEWFTMHFKPKYDELYASTYPQYGGGALRVRAWHLKVIAVHPSCQRRKLGTALVRAVLDKPDRAGKPMTCDVQTSASVQFLQPLGFVYTGVRNFMGRRTGFPLWSLRR
ncbi:hypothetical protein BV25DRAFT_1839939 [Artomyces pyxidatus]|uniref:Uncharacterized protein n=1 Tax=Artomyces pyxidatus TaxID=48021 RepID=A0ACB8STU5_9AGAM|nr:hypothetical protein BV25DRAFT_1839939 [Artomyces pyxidatus]